MRRRHRRAMVSCLRNGRNYAQTLHRFSSENLADPPPLPSLQQRFLRTAAHRFFLELLQTEMVQQIQIFGAPSGVSRSSSRHFSRRPQPHTEKTFSQLITSFQFRQCVGVTDLTQLTQVLASKYAL
jgi:hypothetical protein